MMNIKRNILMVAGMLAAAFLCHVSAVKAADCSAPITDGDALMAWCSDALAAYYSNLEASVRTISQQAHATDKQWMVIGASQVDESPAVVTYQCFAQMGKTAKDAELQLVDPDQVWDPNEPIVIKGSEAGCD